MRLKLHLFLCIVLSLNLSHAQDYSVSQIPDDLTKDANSILLKDETRVEIITLDKIVTTRNQTITVLNKNGNGHVQGYAYYDDHSKVRKLNCYVYDANGEELERFKKYDFIDMSAVDGATLFSDARRLMLPYSPTEYPYTVVLEVETVSDNSAFLPAFSPYKTYDMSVRLSTYEVKVPLGMQVKYKMSGLPEKIALEETTYGYTAFATDLPALKREAYSPSFTEIAPTVYFGLDKFHLAGVDGVGTDWNSFGLWMHNMLLTGLSELPPETKQEVSNLIDPTDDMRTRAKKVYQYMQDKTRYISVQVGIGGWKPMLASDVDNLGYGDCKALTNYTQALLDVVDVPSYYTVLYADSKKRNIQADFTSLQGNHAILAIPEGDDYIWLECTSQEVPFGYLGDFTDDRDVLVITPEGGTIAHTAIYSDEMNILKTTGEVHLNDNGDLKAQVTLTSEGIQYDDRFRIAALPEDDQDTYYKSYWDYIDNINIEKTSFNNDKDNIRFNEDIEFKATSFSTTIGEELLLNVNVLNRYTNVPKRYKNREQEVELLRGFKDEDSYVLHLPEGYTIDKMPEAIEVITEFGSYNSHIEDLGSGSLRYVRTLQVNAGKYPKERYKDFRSFRKKVAKADNQKIILVKQ